MPRRTPRQKRLLGLWTASWLFALLLAGLLRFGDLRVQWPVLLVPAVWALLALARGRGDRSRGPGDRFRGPGRLPAKRRDDDLAGWPPAAGSSRTPAGAVPPTREMPWLPETPPGRRPNGTG